VRGVAAAIAVAGLAGCGTQEDLAPPPRGMIKQPLVLECDGRTTKALTETAVAGPEGLTVVVRNTTDAQLAVSGEEEGGSGAGFGAGPGETRGVYPFRPGPLQIACFDERSDDPSEVPRVTVGVEAEPDAWNNDRLHCTSGGRNALNMDYAADAAGQPEPVQAVQEALERDLRDGGRVEQVGYLGLPRDRTYALVREDRNVALVTMHRPRDGWLVHLIERCGELDRP
jgi:hypothetical protein